VFGILLVEGFVITTLDTAVRLQRYLFEELWQVIFKNVPKIMKSYLFNAALCVVLMYLMAYNNAFLVIWPAFGSANQLLASLALIAVSVWLVNRGINALFTVVPAIFMMVTTIYSLFVLLIEKFLPKGNYALSAFAVVLIVLAIGVIGLAYKKWRELKKSGTIVEGVA
jgi:carbon starvation protein